MVSGARILAGHRAQKSSARRVPARLGRPIRPRRRASGGAVPKSQLDESPPAEASASARTPGLASPSDPIMGSVRRRPSHRRWRQDEKPSLRRTSGHRLTFRGARLVIGFGCTARLVQIAFSATPVDGVEIVPGPLQLLLHSGRSGWRLLGAKHVLRVCCPSTGF